MFTSQSKVDRDIQDQFQMRPEPDDGTRMHIAARTVDLGGKAFQEWYDFLC